MESLSPIAILPSLFFFLLLSFPRPATQNLAFVFMVGDGILNVTLRSPMPLNDNEWHFVQAEINVKLARIKVDWQPWAVRRFPGQTFVTMEFSHPILVGRSFTRLLEACLGDFWI